jgi:hypothetical protein
MFQGADPFPECVCEAEAIILMSYMFASMATMVILVLFMFYFYMKVKKFLPILITFLFSIVIGMTSFGGAFIPFMPFFQIFFMLIQTVFFYLFIDERDFKSIWR